MSSESAPIAVPAIPPRTPVGPGGGASLCRVLPGWPAPFDAAKPLAIGVLPGEGIGPEIMAVALEVLETAATLFDRRVEVRTGGAIGHAAQRLGGRCLTAEVVDFCAATFAAHGAVLCGPGGGRFVYELRRTFDLYCKFSPLAPLPEWRDCGVVRPEPLAGVNIVAVRENVGGVYQGTWKAERDEHGRLVAHQRFSYREDEVDRILAAAFALARQRSGRLCVVVKAGGVPAISELWLNRVGALPVDDGVRIEYLEIDNAAYQLIANPHRFDVIVSSNLFGDILADCGALLLGSRGLSYSGNFGAGGKAVYQTGHGAASDLAGRDRANPTGQLFALAMMLRESFAWPEAADAIVAAVAATVANGWRTDDVAASGSRIVGTRDFGAQVCDALRGLRTGKPSSACDPPCF